MGKDHDVEISIYITDDREIKKINSKYRGKNEPTDVLSFEQDDKMLGDIVISIQTTISQAKANKKKIQEELYSLIVHGTLHLLGYDHEKSDFDKKIMLGLQNKILTAFLLNNK